MEGYWAPCVSLGDFAISGLSQIPHADWQIEEIRLRQGAGNVGELGQAQWYC